MASLPQRIGIVFVALLFFGFASALSIFVVVQAVQDHNAAKSTDASQTAKTPSTAAPQAAGGQLQNFTPVADVPKLQTSDSKVGTGTAITSANQTVTADYTGAVAATGKIFDSSSGKSPLTSQLNGLIPGWQQAMIGMKVGGQRRMLIPADQAYGANPPQGSGIPANAALVFDVTLIDVQ